MTGVAFSRGSAVLALLVLLSPRPSQGQVVKGRLLDDKDDTPISSADVALLVGAEGEKVAGSVLSNEAGWFLLDAGREGRFRLRAERLGYQSVTSPPFDLTASDTLPVELRMSVEAILLAPLTVVSDRPPLVNNIRLVAGGFLDRRSTYGAQGMGSGRFLTREDWEDRSPHRLSDILQDVPGVRIVGGSQIRLRGVTSFGERYGCVPIYYLNGQLFRLGAGESIQEYVSPLEISGIEVYPGLTKPPEFMDMSDHPCGAIVIWTGGGGL